jgi:hypothetical protein
MNTGVRDEFKELMKKKGDVLTDLKMVDDHSILES